MIYLDDVYELETNANTSTERFYVANDERVAAMMERSSSGAAPDMPTPPSGYVEFLVGFAVGTLVDVTPFGSTVDPVRNSPGSPDAPVAGLRKACVRLDGRIAGLCGWLVRSYGGIAGLRHGIGQTCRVYRGSSRRHWPELTGVSREFADESTFLTGVLMHCLVIVPKNLLAAPRHERP